MLFIFRLKILFIFIGVSFSSVSSVSSVEKQSPPGVVQILYLDFRNGNFYSSTGVFIGSGTVATVFHTIQDLKGSVKDNLFFIHPESGRLVPFTEIVALDMLYDSAILKVKGYRSSFFYSIENDVSIREAGFGQQVTAFGFTDGSMMAPGRSSIGKGKVMEGDHYGDTFFKRAMENPYSNEGSVRVGMSGGPVFLETGPMAGIVSSSYEGLDFGFISVHRLKDLLLSQNISCTSGVCIEKEVKRVFDLAEKGHAIAEYRVGLMYIDEAERLLSLKDQEKYAETIKQNETAAIEKLLSAGNKGMVEALYIVGHYLVVKHIEYPLVSKYSETLLGLSLLEQAAHKGHFISQFFLKNIYSGRYRGIEQNNRKSRYWRQQFVAQITPLYGVGSLLRGIYRKVLKVFGKATKPNVSQKKCPLAF